MTFFEILITTLGAIAIGSIFYYVFKATGPFGSIWSFLLILILVGLAAEAWITPVGPVFQDVAWVSTAFVIILFALLLAAATPPAYKKHHVEGPATGAPMSKQEKKTATAISSFFWLFFILLLIAVVWGATLT